MLDVLIKNGNILDGTGKEPVNCDIGLIGDKIEDMVSKKNIFTLSKFFLFKYQFKISVNKIKIINSNISKFIK